MIFPSPPASPGPLRTVKSTFCVSVLKQGEEFHFPVSSLCISSPSRQYQIEDRRKQNDLTKAQKCTPDKHTCKSITLGNQDERTSSFPFNLCFCSWLPTQLAFAPWYFPPNLMPGMASPYYIFLWHPLLSLAQAPDEVCSAPPCSSYRCRRPQHRRYLPFL